MPTARKTVLITGASRGLGYAIARNVLGAPEGHNVVLLARTEAPLRSLESEFGGEGEAGVSRGRGRVAVVVGDVCDEQVAARAVSMAVERFARLDSVVLNHGTVEPIKRIAEITPIQWRETFELNVFSLMNLLLPALPQLRRTMGSVILISSGASVSSVEGWGVYGASKAALNHIAASLGHEERKVTFVALRPGMVNTDMQTLIRQENASMGNDGAKFMNAWKEGKLLDPMMVGGLAARMATGLCGQKEPSDISGRFLSWDDEALKSFRRDNV